MDNEREYTKPGYLKLRELEELKQYCIKYNKDLDEDLLKKNNFTPLEIEWVKIFHEEEIEMNNKKIIQKLKNKIDELREMLGHSSDKVLKQTSRIEELQNTTLTKTKNVTKFVQYKNEWVVTETYNKKVNNHYIDSENVMNVWTILRKNTSRTFPAITYRELVQQIIKFYDLKVGLDAFNGGHNRAKHLFPKYFYPIKILNHLGLVHYNKHGMTIRLEFGNKKYAQIIKG